MDTGDREAMDRLSSILSPIIRDTSLIINWHLETQSGPGQEGEGGSVGKRNLSFFTLFVDMWILKG